MSELVLWIAGIIVAASTAIWAVVKGVIIPARLKALEDSRKLESLRFEDQIRVEAERREFEQNKWETEKARIDSEIGFLRLTISKGLNDLFDKQIILSGKIDKLFRHMDQINNSIRILTSEIEQLDKG